MTRTDAWGAVRPLRGALFLAIGRAAGLHDMPQDAPGAARSFIAAALALPPFLATLALAAQVGGPTLTVRHVALDFLGFVIGWAGYAVVSHHLAGALGRARQWPRFIATWNWINLIQYLILLLATLPALSGSAPVAQLAALAGQAWALGIEFHAIRLSLEVSPLQAAGMMLPDIAIGLGLALALAALGAG